MITLPATSVKDWAIKDLLSREYLPPEADDLQRAAASRRQIAELQVFAGHACRRYAETIDLPAAEITEQDTIRAALAIGELAAQYRRELANEWLQFEGVELRVPPPEQLQADAEVCRVLQAAVSDLANKV